MSETKKKKVKQIEDEVVSKPKKKKVNPDEDNTKKKKVNQVEEEVEEEEGNTKLLIIGGAVGLLLILGLVIGFALNSGTDDETASTQSELGELQNYDYLGADESSSSSNAENSGYPELEQVEPTEFVPPTREEFIDMFFDGVEVEYPKMELNEAGELVAVDEYTPAHVQEGAEEEVAAVYTDEELAEIQKQIDEIKARNATLEYDTGTTTQNERVVTDEEIDSLWNDYTNPDAPRSGYVIGISNAG